MDNEKFFQVVGDDGRRGYVFKLFKKRSRLDVGRFKFANRVCEEWNGLDDDVVGSVNAFKRKLDHHLRNVRVYQGRSWPGGPGVRTPQPASSSLFQMTQIR